MPLEGTKDSSPELGGRALGEGGLRVFEDLL